MLKVVVMMNPESQRDALLCGFCFSALEMDRNFLYNVATRPQLFEGGIVLSIG